jgi:exoribonuclease II
MMRIPRRQTQLEVHNDRSVNAYLEQRIRAADEALLTRWLEVTNHDDHRVEIQAIVDAIKGLRVLKGERLRDSSGNL